MRSNFLPNKTETSNFCIALNVHRATVQLGKTLELSLVYFFSFKCFTLHQTSGTFFVTKEIHICYGIYKNAVCYRNKTRGQKAKYLAECQKADIWRMK